MEKQTLIIDGNKFSDLDSFHNEMDNVLTKDLDWKTGHNLDAFNDLLRGGFGVHEYGEPIRIIWKNSAKSKQDFGFGATAKYFSAMLLTCHPESVEYVQSELDRVKAHEGETVFDIIMEIIKGHEHIELVLD